MNEINNQLDTLQTIDMERRERAQKATIDDLKKTIETQHKMIDILEKKIDILSALKEAKNDAIIIKPTEKTKTSESIAMACLGDIHGDETVKRNKVNGLNEYNPTVCERRITKYFANLVYLIKIHSAATKINSMVLFLLGDAITAYLHEENAPTNSMSPIEGTIFILNLYFGGIRYILKHTDLLLKIVCHVGNHSRLTEKMTFGNANEMSLEYLVYCMLKNEFKNEKRVEIYIPDAGIAYTSIYNKTVRSMHGHEIRYAGGVGGILIPAMKYIHRANTAKFADITVFGHHHYQLDFGSGMCNGCVIGYNNLAQSRAYEYQLPQQLLFFIEKDKGKTATQPIFLD